MNRPVTRSRQGKEEETQSSCSSSICLDSLFKLIFCYVYYG
jgi:hypothetical protein